METLQPPKTILHSSITEMLARRQPVILSAIRRIGRIGLFSIACAASAVAAHGQSAYTWNGSGTTGNWSNSSNWSGGSAPSNGAEIHFAGTTNLTTSNDLNLTGQNANGVNGLFFDTNASSFVLNGNGLTLSNQAHTPNGLVNNSSTAQTINIPILLSNAQNGETWTAAGGNITFNSTVNLGGNSLTLAGANDFIFNGVISDSATGSSAGGLIIQNSNNSGTFLVGANTYTGSTIVNAGILFLNGSIASAQTSVNSGGILIGNGTIGGNLTNGGVVIPVSFNTYDFSSGFNAFEAALKSALAFGVNSITGVPLPSLTSTSLALTVKGNYTQTQSGALLILYAGAANNEHTSLNVQGQANLNGALRLIQLDGGRLQVGQQVPILTATGGVTGKFSLVENASLINANVVYEPTSVVLETSQGSVASTLKTISGVSGNLLSVASGLDSAANDPRAAKIFAILNSDTVGQLARDVEHINPDKLTSMTSAGAASSGVHLQNLQLRMQALQSGATGFSAMGFHITDNSTDSSAGYSGSSSAYAGPTGPEDKGGKEVAPPPANHRWGTFITGAGEFDRVGDTQAAPGFNLDSGGITVGFDYRFTDHFVAGLFAGYTYTGINIADGGRIAVDTGKIGLYATYFDGGFYVNSAVQGGYDGYEANRVGIGGIAHSSPTGGDLNVLFAPGYNWTSGGFTYGPTARFQYGYQSTGGFTESGSLAPLSVGSQHTESIVSAFGMKASYDWKIGTTIIRPELRLEWEHEYGDVATTVASQLASGAGSGFTVTGPQIGRDDLHLGAGVAVVLSERLTTYVYYDGQFFRTNYDSSTVTGGFRFLF